MPFLFSLPTLALTDVVDEASAVHVECCPFQRVYGRRDYAEDKALVPTSVTCGVAVKLARVMCSARGSGSTALTALGGPLAPWDSLHWTYTGVLGSGGICSMQDQSKSKSFFAAVCFGCRLVLLQCALRSEKLLGAVEIPAHTPCCSWFPSPASWEKV